MTKSSKLPLTGAAGRGGVIGATFVKRLLRPDKTEDDVAHIKGVVDDDDDDDDDDDNDVGDVDDECIDDCANDIDVGADV